MVLVSSSVKKKDVGKGFLFLAPTGALEQGILCVRLSVWYFPQKNTANEFLKHSKESRGLLGQAGKQAGKKA